MSPLPASDRRPLAEAPIDISHVEALIDQFGPVRLTVFGLPSQARLTAGRLNHDGSWTVRPNELAGLAVRAPEDLPEFDIELVPELEPSVGATAQIDCGALVTGDGGGEDRDDSDAPQTVDHGSWVDLHRDRAIASEPRGDAASGGGWVAALDG